MKAQASIAPFTSFKDTMRPDHSEKPSLARNRLPRIGCILGLLTLLCLGSVQLFAQATSESSKALVVPPLINYSGVLKDSTGKPLTGTVDITFSIYKDSQGGAPLWMETQDLQVDSSGHYSVMLGSTSSQGLPEDLFAYGEPRWLSVQVQGELESQRALLVAVPYALKAADAATIGGLPPSAFVRANPKATGLAVGSGTPQPSSASTSNPPSSGKSALSGNIPCSSLTGGGTTNFLSLWTTGCNLGNSVVSQAGVSIGIGTPSPGSLLELAQNAPNSTGPIFFIHNTATLLRGHQNSARLTFGLDAGASASVGNAFIQAQEDPTGYGTSFQFGTVADGGQVTERLRITPTGSVGIGTTVPASTLDVRGSINTSQIYKIGGAAVLNLGNVSDLNLFVGPEAGQHNIAGQGISNMFVSTDAGFENTTGTSNTFSGQQAGFNNTTGYENTFYGTSAGGASASGSFNTYVGAFAGPVQPNSSYNIFIGDSAGSGNESGGSNVYIASIGTDESNTIRIGTQGSGDNEQNATYIAGIYGVNVGGIPVQISSNGRLGAQTSSQRFKEQIRDMGDSTSALMKLRPVTFLYKPEYANGDRSLQYGLIAEEVAQVYPELVAYDNDGKPYTVRYQYLASMLLNEVQKQQQEIESLKLQLQQQNASLEERLQKLESRISSQMQTASDENIATVSRIKGGF